MAGTGLDWHVRVRQLPGRLAVAVKLRPWTQPRPLLAKPVGSAVDITWPAHLFLARAAVNWLL